MTVDINVVDKEFVETQLKNLFQSELKNLVRWKVVWKKTGNICLGLSKALVATALLFDFVSGYYDNKDFTFFAGCSNTTALVLMTYSSYAFTESKRRNNNLSRLLKKVNVKTNSVYEMSDIVNLDIVEEQKGDNKV